MLRIAHLAFCLIAASATATAAQAATHIGLYGEWGAFRHGASCYALRLPENAENTPGAYLSLVMEKDSDPQFVARLEDARARAASASASVGGRRFVLTGGGHELRAQDARMDRALIVAIRTARALSIETVGQDGEAIVNAYDLRGAASAIDAARLACR